MNVRKIILEEYRRQRSLPFAWGTADCLTFCGDCARLILGRDPIAHLRGRYDSELSCMREMKKEGWAERAHAAASLFEEIPVAQAQSGDWVRIFNPDRSESLGVVIGAQVAARAQDGMGIASLTAADKAFRVA